VRSPFHPIATKEAIAHSKENSTTCQIVLNQTSLASKIRLLPPKADSHLTELHIVASRPEETFLLLKISVVEVKESTMLLTRQQAKAQKRNAKRLGQLLKEARTELEQSLAALEDTAIENGSWGMTEMSYSQDAYSLIGQILALADKWEQCNHFEIDEQLAQIEKKVYID
jgi:hypothetical protein